MQSNKPAEKMSALELAQFIDHSVLKPEFSIQEVTNIINEGIAMGCKTVCVQGCNVDLALKLTSGTTTKVAPCVGFPQGACDTAVKVFEAELYSKKGVYEIDMVSNFGWIRSGLYDQVEAEIRAVVEVAHRYDVAVKVILETDTLTVEQIVEATKCVIRAGADFVKTSTGFITGVPSNGATFEVIQLMMNTVEGKIKVKGSAGIRTREHFLKLIDMGIDRMGIGYKSTALVLGLAEVPTSKDNY